MVDCVILGVGGGIDTWSQKHLNGLHSVESRDVMKIWLICYEKIPT